jgi:hypothetical protein
MRLQHFQNTADQLVYIQEMAMTYCLSFEYQERGIYVIASGLAGTSLTEGRTYPNRSGEPITDGQKLYTVFCCVKRLVGRLKQLNHDQTKMDITIKVSNES